MLNNTKPSETSLHQHYIVKVRAIEDNLKRLTSGDSASYSLAEIQQQLDTLAEKFQYDDRIGAARYKLYELQALIYYFDGNDEDALSFIDQAELQKGATYARSEKLRNQILHHPHHSQLMKDGQRERLVGLEGWLALFVASLGIGAIINLVNVLGYPSYFNEIMSVQDKAPDIVAAMVPALWFEVLQFVALIAGAVYIIVLLAKRKQLAKKMTIIFLITAPVLGIIDYAWASSIFTTYSIDVGNELSKESGNIGRAIMTALIWIPYFLVSKRIKATLTE